MVGAVAQSVERSTRGQEMACSILAPGALSQLVGSVSVECDRLRQKSWSSGSVSVLQHIKLSDASLGARP